MRFSRTAWLILALGVVVIAFASLCVVYFRQASEQKDLKSSLAGAEARLPQVISDRGALESQLAQRQSELAEAESSLSEAKAKFPLSAESIEYGEVLFGIADDCDLEVVSLTASAPSEEEVGEVTYAVTSFDMEVRGEVVNILDFINDIATSEYFTSATVEVVNINVPETPSATIQIVIYSYQGE